MKKQKTFAQRAKDIEKKFEGRNDDVSKRTKNALMQDLREEQESLKASMQPEQLGQPEQSNQANYGALLTNGRAPVQSVNALNPTGVTPLTTQGPSADLSGEGIGGSTGGGPGVGAYLGAATTALDLGKTAFGDTGIDTSGKTEAPEVQGAGLSAAGGALKGAGAGAAFGPWGAAIGGVVGGVAGLLGGNKAKKAAEKAEHNFDLSQANSYRPENFAMGGKVNTYEKGGGPLKWLFDKTQTNKEGESVSRAGKGLEWLGKNAGNIAQYATALGPLTQKFEGAETPKGTRIEGKTTLGRLDDQSMLNRLKGSVNVNEMAREGSGGSLAAYRTGARIGNKQFLEAQSNLAQGAKKVNLDQSNAEKQINLQERMTNMAADERFLDREARDKGALASAKQANRAAIFDNIGAIGREESNKKLVKEMYGYKWDGTYVRDAKGKIVTDKDGKPLTNEALKEAKKSLPSPTGNKTKG